MDDLSFDRSYKDICKDMAFQGNLVAERRHAQMVLATVVANDTDWPGTDEWWDNVEGIARHILAWQPGEGKPTEGEGV